MCECKSLCCGDETQLRKYRDRLDGDQKQIPYSVLLKRPDLRHRASNIK